MNEEQYQALCNACDRILLAQDSTIERVAIPWLHVIREHPVILANYSDLFETAKGWTVLLSKWRRNILYRAGWYGQLEKALRSEGQPWFGPDHLPGKIDVLFVSHLLNKSHAGQADDFYFGKLPNEMITRGHSTVIALINHSGQSAASLASRWEKNSVPRVVLSESLCFGEEVALCRRLKKESLRLRKLAEKEGTGLVWRILTRAAEEGLSSGALTNIRMFSQISLLAAKLQPKSIVVTHEGHAWERIAFSAARTVCPNVKCIGYQHAALFRLQHAIRRNLAREYNPDQILTAGTVGKSQLESTPKLQGIPISVLGSNRTFNKATINGEHLMHPRQAEHLSNSVCLVLPEGLVSECFLLFEFSLNCAKAFPEIQFIWRLHPVVNFKSLLAQNPKLRNLPRNIVLSKATLEEDIARCRYALYRGTTAIVQAVMAGLRPIYLQLPNEMTIDPLYELDGSRTYVKTMEDFYRAIRHNQEMLLKETESEFRFAERYCGCLFTALNPSVLESAITSICKS